MRLVHLLPLLAACDVSPMEVPREADAEGLKTSLWQAKWEDVCLNTSTPMPATSPPTPRGIAGTPAIVQSGASDLHRVTLDTVAFPEAICNDGSPASMYVDTTLGSESWVVHLDGGGNCTNYEECLDRWCDQFDENVFPRPPNMMGEPLPDDININGIMSESGLNAFSTFNRVYVPYCSSDNWMGDAAVSWLSPNGSVKMDVEFRGKEILRAVAYTLAEGQWVSDDGLVSAPAKLATADTIVLSGTSAGAAGVLEEVDRFRELIETTSGTQASFHAIIDALYTSELPNSNADDALIGGIFDFASLVNAELDASCVADLGYVEDCVRMDVLLAEYVKTPSYLMVNRCDKVLNQSARNAYTLAGAPWSVNETDIIGNGRWAGLQGLSAANADIGYQMRQANPNHVLVTSSAFLNSYDTNAMSWVNGTTITLPGSANVNCPALP